MKIHVKTILLAVAVWFALVFNSFAADTGTVNLVKPIVAPPAVESIKDAKGKRTCSEGLVLQKSDYCCPAGTSAVWPYVCTPAGTIEDQIFNYNDVTHYCPRSDMFIVSDKNADWASCADSSSTVMYSAAKGSEGGQFCRKHGYGHLIKIKPRGTVGCIKIGDSQGDGCIEAGSCSFTPPRN